MAVADKTTKNMAKSTLTSVVLVILFCGSAVGTRPKKLFSTKIQDGVSAATDDGICKLMVETQGYTCEEHTVMYLHLSNVYNF